MSDFQNSILAKVNRFELARDDTGGVKESIRQNIFLCKEVSNEIADYVIEENWGIKNRELYHLLDYKFRISCINGDLKEYSFYENGQFKEIAIFHTGLLRRIDSKHLFIVCKKNSQKQPAWMVQGKPKKNGNIQKANEWLLTKEEINDRYGKYGIIAPQILNYGRQKHFNKYCKIHWDWYNILRNQLKIKSKRKMIFDELHTNGVETKFIHRKIVNVLYKKFENAVRKSSHLYSQNNDYIKQGLFINKDKKSFVVDLMMYITIEVHNKELPFVIRFNKHPYRNQYEFIDLLNLKRGYQNGRQISVLPEMWWYETENMLNYYSNYNTNSSINSDDNSSRFDDSTINSDNTSDIYSTTDSNDTSDDDIKKEEKNNNDNINNNINNNNNNNNNGQFIPEFKQTIKNHVQWDNGFVKYELNEYFEYNMSLNKYITKKDTLWFDRTTNKITIFNETENECTSTIKCAKTNNILSKTVYIRNNKFIKYIGYDYENNMKFSFTSDLTNYNTTFDFGCIYQYKNNNNNNNNNNINNISNNIINNNILMF